MTKIFRDVFHVRTCMQPGSLGEDKEPTEWRVDFHHEGYSCALNLAELKEFVAHLQDLIANAPSEQVEWARAVVDGRRKALEEAEARLLAAASKLPKPAGI